HLFRHQAGRMVVRLTRLLGPAHVGLAEETVQEAMLRALQTWPYQGVPDNAAGWLFRVAHNLAIDAVRRDKTFGDKTDVLLPELRQRLDSVLEVLYLMFNEGYAAHEGEELVRHDLCYEALRLGRLVASASIRRARSASTRDAIEEPIAAPRVHALVALMALQAARLPARVDAAGDLVLLDFQDRSR